MRQDNHVLQTHDEMLGEKLAAALKAVPAEHTIAGGVGFRV